MKNDYIWVRYALYITLTLLAVYFMMSPALRAIATAKTGEVFFLQVIADWLLAQLKGLFGAVCCGGVIWLIKQSKLGYY
ncbi:hypothetical protein [Vibrio mediterranei]|uniref:hypothetical protein n=1 Tax=Vibrio mediterranei TaxID=689 RepID=UPI0040692A1D